MAQLRRTRIVCISDTHNCTIKLPKGDVLIHAGDLTNQGSHSELSKTVKWLEQTGFEAKIVVAGNHDITLDTDFFQEHGLHYHNHNIQSPEECLSLFTSSSSITYLNHESATIRLCSPSGPRTQFKIFGSPYSPRVELWAFSYDAPQSTSDFSGLTHLWDSIPLDTDIVVTHTPPRNHCDETTGHLAVGCEALRRALWQVRPRLAVCGHVHPSRGSERVVWDLNSQNNCFSEENTIRWQDPGQDNKKISLVDLTGRKGPSLANDGSHPPKISDDISVSTLDSPPFVSSSGKLDAQVCSSTIGLEVDVRPPRADQAALVGRMGRLETCVVNAAIMKSNWPHLGGKQFNKPIVVDINLPIWDGTPLLV